MNASLGDKLLPVGLSATLSGQFRDSYRQQAAVARFGQRALEASDLSLLFDEAVALVRETLDVSHASVLERRPNGSIALRAGVDWDEGRGGVCVLIPGSVASFGVLAALDESPREFTQDAVYFLEAIANVLGTSVDRHRTQAALSQTQRLEAIGRLASGVSHDFNNILAAITGFATWIHDRLPPDSPLREDANQILKAASRASGLTRQLLVFGRQQVLEPQLVMLNDVVTQMEKMLHPLLGPEIALEHRLSSELGFVKADPGKIEQVILNLCVNARDAMPDGGRLTIETANAPERYVVLTVTDTGVGMDAETQAHAFEPFFTTKTVDRGTGLGLAMVYGIVKQSGGDVTLHSEPGAGTQVKVLLPRL